MPLCPYCNSEIELKLSLSPVEIDQDFKDNAIKAMESFIEIQADVMPFGGGLAKRFGKIALKFARKYFDKIGAYPVIVLSCKNCGNTISADTFQASEFFPMSSGGGR